MTNSDVTPWLQRSISLYLSTKKSRISSYKHSLMKCSKFATDLTHLKNVNSPPGFVTKNWSFLQLHLAQYVGKSLSNVSVCLRWRVTLVRYSRSLPMLMCPSITRHTRKDILGVSNTPKPFNLYIFLLYSTFWFQHIIIKWNKDNQYIPAEKIRSYLMKLGL